MTDAELAAYLQIPVALVPRIEPKKRAAYENIAKVEQDLWLWEHGLGPKPTGVIVCRDHERPPHRKE